jgi:hypothetical protein
MKTPEEWKSEFQHRVAEAIGHVDQAGNPIGYDINKIIEELAEDIQNDAVGREPVVRVRYGIVTKAEAEKLSNDAKQSDGN